MSEQVYIIAEAGVNHNGSPDMALALVDHAADAGADAVKFQTFTADRLVTATAPKAKYQGQATGAGESHTMLARLELSEQAHERIIARCAARDIQFMSTPFDLESLRLLVERFDLRRIKLGSGEVTNGPLLLAAARSGRNLVSTGMATLEEIETALGVFAFGFAGASGPPGLAAFRAAYANPNARETLAEKVTLLHCTSAYPAPTEDANLCALNTLRSAFGIPVGYSDHTLGIAVAIAAVAKGAVIIEKHFTCDRGLPGPDHAASLEPAEFAAMVNSIRQVELALGDGIKGPRPCEIENIPVARKSIVAGRPIAAGEPFSTDNLAIKRPATGASPMIWWDIQGTQARRAYKGDEAIDL